MKMITVRELTTSQKAKAERMLAKIERLRERSDELRALGIPIMTRQERACETGEVSDGETTELDAGGED